MSDASAFENYSVKLHIQTPVPQAGRRRLGKEEQKMPLYAIYTRTGTRFHGVKHMRDLEEDGIGIT